MLSTWLSIYLVQSYFKYNKERSETDYNHEFLILCSDFTLITFRVLDIFKQIWVFRVSKLWEDENKKLSKLIFLLRMKSLRKFRSIWSRFLRSFLFYLYYFTSKFPNTQNGFNPAVDMKYLICLFNSVQGSVLNSVASSYNALKTEIQFYIENIKITEIPIKLLEYGFHGFQSEEVRLLGTISQEQNSNDSQYQTLPNVQIRLTNEWLLLNILWISFECLYHRYKNSIRKCTMHSLMAKFM